MLVLSQHIETSHAIELVTLGGFGYLLKDRVLAVDEFLDAAERVARGGSALDPHVVGRLLGHGRRAGALAELSDREREVLELMAEGLTNAGIAERLSSASAPSRRTYATCWPSSTSPTARTAIAGCWPWSRTSARCTRPERERRRASKGGVITMNDRHIRATLTNMVTNLDADAEYEQRHDDFVAGMPQSGKRFRGPANIRAMQRAFTAPIATNVPGPASRVQRRRMGGRSDRGLFWPIAQARVR